MHNEQWLSTLNACISIVFKSGTALLDRKDITDRLDQAAWMADYVQDLYRERAELADRISRVDINAPR